MKTNVEKIHIVGHSAAFIVMSLFDPIDSESETDQVHLIPEHYEREKVGDVNVVFDFVDSAPFYERDDGWWRYVKWTNVVHVMLEVCIRDKYIELMEKKKSDFGISDIEMVQLNYCERIMHGAALAAAKLAVKKYYEVIKRKRTNRTKRKAGDVTEVPNLYAIITNKTYQNAMGLFHDGKAYLQPLTSSKGLEYKEGKLYFKGLAASEAQLKDQFAKKAPECVDLPLLRIFYSIILSDINKKMNENKQPSPIYKVYLPDFFGLFGKRTISRDQVESLINNIMSFHTLVGIIDGDILPVLVYLGENQKENTITFSSPYMNRVIEKVWKVSIRTDKKGNPKLMKNGETLMLPSHSYLIKPSIRKEKNQKAVEIVHIITTLIEQAGNNVPNIKARTIVERNMQLRYSLEGQTTPHKNTMLQRAFTKAWELLRTQTHLEEAYPGIELPDPKDPKNIPTVSQLDHVYTFPHKGKNKAEIEKE